jgi:hypothetical protein
LFGATKKVTAKNLVKVIAFSRPRFELSPLRMQGKRMSKLLLRRMKGPKPESKIIF